MRNTATGANAGAHHRLEQEIPKAARTYRLCIKLAAFGVTSTIAELYEADHPLIG